MGFIVSAGVVRAAWAAGGQHALDELAASARDHPAARGNDLADLQGCLDAAVDRLAGVTETTRTVLTEVHDNVGACLAAYEATDGRSTGTFNVLTAVL